jgi:branched-chain amino acid aminotransferase
MSGTAAELVPVREIDDHPIGGPERTAGVGEITKEIQRVYDDALHGRDPRYAEWLDVVQVSTGHTARAAGSV